MRTIGRAETNLAHHHLLRSLRRELQRLSLPSSINHLRELRQPVVFRLHPPRVVLLRAPLPPISRPVMVISSAAVDLKSVHLRLERRDGGSGG